MERANLVIELLQACVCLAIQAHWLKSPSVVYRL